MQDNVTQAVAWGATGDAPEWGVKPFYTHPTKERVEDLIKGYRNAKVFPLFLASTAQPEVKALVEALEAIKAQTSAEDDAGENYRWDDREGALDFAYATAAQALAAHHEAQP